MEPAPTAMPTSGKGLEKTLAGLPVATRRAGETVLSAGLKTELLLILKKGSVAIVKDSIEIAIVDQPGAVLGELSALLDQPHTAEVRALEDSQFYVADAILLEKDPSALLYVARIMAGRLLAADIGLVSLKKQIQGGQSSTSLRRIVDRIQKCSAPVPEWIRSKDRPLLSMTRLRWGVPALRATRGEHGSGHVSSWLRFAILTAGILAASSPILFVGPVVAAAALVGNIVFLKLAQPQ